MTLIPRESSLFLSSRSAGVEPVILKQPRFPTFGLSSSSLFYWVGGGLLTDYVDSLVGALSSSPLCATSL